MTVTQQIEQRCEKKGIQKGIQKGLRKGREEGIYEGIKRTARKMLIDGVTLKNIKKYTGLKTAELQALREN